MRNLYRTRRAPTSPRRRARLCTLSPAGAVSQAWRGGRYRSGTDPRTTTDRMPAGCTGRSGSIDLRLWRRYRKLLQACSLVVRPLCIYLRTGIHRTFVASEHPSRPSFEEKRDELMSLIEQAPTKYTASRNLVRGSTLQLPHVSTPDSSPPPTQLSVPHYRIR
ncbi:hypothetical protein CALCODRAFT_514952 [Calocera cornea HHB12733]|uniref:Uncharacterized protein n=1 Tax=Calocera cornea HHB12733 TaxID=1353952 RepID=A0A165IUR6_9BASI|nr:hypothetical protein CALCODRAFT_514952 [Calocera cornea HHB12733]